MLDYVLGNYITSRLFKYPGLGSYKTMLIVGYPHSG